MKHSYSIEGLQCANCAAKIERKISVLPEMEEVSVSIATSTLRFNLKSGEDPDLKLLRRLNDIVGMIEQGAFLILTESEEPRSSLENHEIACQCDHDHDHGPGSGPMGHDMRQQADIAEIRATERTTSEQVVCLPWYRQIERREILRLTAAMIPFGLALLLPVAPAISLSLLIVAYLIAGYQVILVAMKRLFSKNPFDENVLMTIATVGAFAVGEYPEAAAVMIFYRIGELFQDLAVRRSRREITSITHIRPDRANRLISEEPFRYSSVAAQTIKPGETIVILPGDRVPLDGVVLRGASDLDTSAMTGEALAVQVVPGDTVLSGSVNLSGLLWLNVTHPYEDSAVSRVLRMVEEAASRKAPAEQFITRFARYYTPAMVLLAVLIAVLPALFGAVPFRESLYHALILLVISCPCALILSVPIGYFAGIGRASADGILIKGGNYLDRMAGIQQVVFDKTGTLTEGEFDVAHVIPLADRLSVQPTIWLNQEILLNLATFAEQHSNHPIARSLPRELDSKARQQIAGILMASSDSAYQFTEESGHGVIVETATRCLILGNQSLLLERGVDLHALNSIELPPHEGPLLYIALSGQLLGVIYLRDRLRDDAAVALRELKKLGIKHLSVMSGDHEAAVQSLAQRAGLDHYQANLLPDDKVRALENLMQSAEGTVDKELVTAFVGDGINDAPVLKRADVGIAFGSASEAAIEGADLVVMGHRLGSLPYLLRLARKTRNIVRENIIFSLGMKLIVLILALFNLGNIWLAVFADVGVAVLAVLNSIRLLRPL